MYLLFFREGSLASQADLQHLARAAFGAFATSLPALCTRIINSCFILAPLISGIGEVWRK